MFPILGIDDAKIEVYYDVLKGCEAGDLEKVVDEAIANMRDVPAGMVSVLKDACMDKARRRHEETLKITAPMDKVSQERLREIMKPILGEKKERLS